MAWRTQFYSSALTRSALASSLGLRTGQYRVPSDLDLCGPQTLTDLVRPSLVGALSVFLVGLLMAIPRDLGRARARCHGRRLKGPEVVSARRFNRRTRADGVAFTQVSGLAARLMGVQRSLAIPRAIESSHLLIMGDSGTGKSALIRQLLCQLEARGDTAVVYDPALEYTPQFYTPERGLRAELALTAGHQREAVTASSLGENGSILSWVTLNDAISGVYRLVASSVPRRFRLHLPRIYRPDAFLHVPFRVLSGERERARHSVAIARDGTLV